MSRLNEYLEASAQKREKRTTQKRMDWIADKMKGTEVMKDQCELGHKGCQGKAVYIKEGKKACDKCASWEGGEWTSINKEKK